MSDPGIYREVAAKRFSEAAKRLEAELKSLDLPAEVLAKVLTAWREQADKSLKESFETGTWLKIEQQNLIEFVDQLLNRQGNIEPDFDELYKRKAELDRKLDDPHP